MDDQASIDGMPQLDRQPVPVRRDALGRPLAPSRVPETRPTPLQGAFIYLSAVALVCGVVVITALELGTPPSSPVVKLPALIGGFLLALVTVDAIVRVWRSAFAWLPVDRGLGLFRFVWVAVLVAVLVAMVLAVGMVVAA